MDGPVYADRSDAGRRLAELVTRLGLARPAVAAIPRGGVPVGVEISRALACPLKLIVLRKLFIPHSPEAGFGAMAPDGTVWVDETFAARLGLTRTQVQDVIAQVRSELEHRRRLYESVGAADVRGRDVVLTDDGIAAGYSMSAAARYVRTLRPASLRIAVPCAPEDSLRRVRPLVDDVICPAVSSAFSFAVANFYHEWHDLTDAEVRAFLAPGE